MHNHYHLFLRTPEPNLVAGMSWLQNTLTRRYNVRHRQWGRVFGDRYKAVVLQGEDAYHYQTLMDYIHLNPVRALVIRPRQGESVLDYPWSSIAGGYALPPTRRPKWLATAAGFKAFNLADTTAGRRQMVARLDRRARCEAIKNCGVPALEPEQDARGSHLRRGWYWGAQAFGEAMREMAQALLRERPPQSRAYRGSPQVREHGERQAEEWLKQGLQAAGMTIETLPLLKGSDPRKLLLAELLWKRTTVSQEWLAQKLGMRSAANVSQQLRRLDRVRALAKIPSTLKAFLEKTRESNQ